MGGCFPCFGSSNKEGSSGGGGVKEVSKKELGKGGSATQSHHVTRVSSGEMKFPVFSIFENFLFLVFLFELV